MWLKIRLIGTTSNTFGIGARVEVTAGNLSQTKTVTAGNSFYSQSSYEKIFGFGNYSGNVDATIFWPSGIVQHVKGIALNQKITITER